MGLTKENAPSANTVYVSIVAGLLHVKVAEGTPEAKERTNKLGEKVFETRHKGLSGIITNIAITEADKSKYGRELIIKFVDKEEGKNYILQTPVGGGYAYGVLSRIANLDFTKETEIRTFAIEDRQKPDGKGGFKINNVSVLYQDGAKVEALPKEQIPPMEKLQVSDGNGGLKDFIDPSTNKPKWDETKRLLFWESLIYGEGGINEKLIELYAKGVNGIAGSEKTGEEEGEDITDTSGEGQQKSEEEAAAGVKAEGEAQTDFTAEMNAEADAQKAEATATAKDGVKGKDAVLEGVKNAQKKEAAKAPIKKAAAKKAAKK